MTKLDELKTLRDKVKAGALEGHPREFCSVGAEYACWAAEAYKGSLDFARPLHELVLPGWEWAIRTDPDDAFTALVVLLDGPEAEADFEASYENPARAWLLAIIEALIWQEERE